MKTYAVLLGNTDMKLNLLGWSRFVSQIEESIKEYGTVHFAGGAKDFSPYMNACFVFECASDDVAKLQDEVRVIRKRFKQDSVAWTEGQTVFI